MKKVASVAVSIGVILVIIGLVLVGIYGRDIIKDGFTVGFNHDLSKVDVRDYKPIEGLREINIEVASYTVYMLPSEDESLSVQYISPSKEDATVSVYNDNGILHIVQKDTRTINWFLGNNWLNNKRFIAVYVPQSGVFDIVWAKIKAETAGIYAKDVNFYSFEGRVDTGSIYLEDSSFVEYCLTEIDTGSITIKNVKTGTDILANTNTGSVKAELLSTNCFKSYVDTGSVSITASNVDNVIVQVDTGSITCRTNSKTLSAKTDTGSINFQTNASVIDLVTDTGSIKGEVQGNKHEFEISVEKGTGSSNIVDQHIEGYLKRLNVAVDTGSIKIDFFY